MLAPGELRETNTNNLSDIFEEINAAGKKQNIVKSAEGEVKCATYISEVSVWRERFATKRIFENS